MVETTRHRLKEFGALDLVGVGGISVVFSAIHLAAYNTFNHDRPVALKFVWSVAQAQQEVRRLILLDSNRGVNKLYGYFEAPLEEVRALLAPLFSEGQVFHSAEGAAELVGVLVMQLSKGCHLTKTRALESAAHELGRDEWVIDYEGRPYLQSLTIPLSLAQRITIVRNLMKVIIEAHEQVPPQVHGDLHPGNVHYDPRTEEVVVLDWSGLDIYGAAGWITPFHDRLILNEIQALPLQTDVFLIALWVDRLLGNEDRAFRRLANRVLVESKELDIKPFFNAFEQISGKVVRRFKFPYWMLLVLGVLVLQGKSLGIIERFRLYDRETQEVLERHGKRRAFRLKNGGIDQAEVYDLSRPQALYVSRRTSFVIYGGLPFVEGDLINNDWIITSISSESIGMASQKSKRSMALSFQSHPYKDLARRNLGSFLLFDAPVREIAKALSIQLKDPILIISDGDPVLRGLVYSNDPHQLMPRIFGAEEPEDVAGKNTGYGAQGKFILYWDLAPDQLIEGDLYDLVHTYLGKRMGYDVSETPLAWKGEFFQRELVTPTSCLRLFLEASTYRGYRMSVDLAGTKLTFEKRELEP